MIIEVKVPSPGESITEVEIESWLVSDGDYVETYAPQGSIGRLPVCANIPQSGGDCIKEKFKATLPNGVQHSVLNAGRGSTDNTGVFTVPEGNYFFVGDNRDNSTDSRVPSAFGGVGYVPYDNLIGRADRVMFSSAGRSLFFFWTWRADRFFKKLQ